MTDLDEKTAVTLESALAKVGVTTDRLVADGGSVLTAGRAYLVGSLAQGLGNGGSDIDIHLFAPDVTQATPPYLFFIGAVPVDVEHYPVDEPDRITSALDPSTAPTPLGDIAVRPVLGHWHQLSLTRWITALPLDPQSPPLLNSAQLRTASAHLLRSTVDKLVRAWALAELADAARRDSTYLWRLCGRAFLDMLCAAQGHPPLGDKWLPARVRKAAITPSLARATADLAGSKDAALLAEQSGLPSFDPLHLVRVDADPAAESVRIGKDRFVLSQHGKLHEPHPVKPGTVAESLACHGAGELVDLLSKGLARLSVDADSVSGVLSGGTS